jgi:hypothetical protein
MQPGYDHGYYFMQTFMADHLRHHAAILEEVAEGGGRLAGAPSRAGAPKTRRAGSVGEPEPGKASARRRRVPR